MSYPGYLWSVSPCTYLTELDHSKPFPWENFPSHTQRALRRISNYTLQEKDKVSVHCIGFTFTSYKWSLWTQTCVHQTWMIVFIDFIILWKNTNLPQEANYLMYKIAELAIVWLKSKVFLKCWNKNDSVSVFCLFWLAHKRVVVVVVVVIPFSSCYWHWGHCSLTQRALVSVPFEVTIGLLICPVRSLPGVHWPYKTVTISVWACEVDLINDY